MSPLGDRLAIGIALLLAATAAVASAPAQTGDAGGKLVSLLGVLGPEASVLVGTMAEHPRMVVPP